MSSICGYFNRDGAPATAGTLDPVMAKMVGYGLDGSHSWVDGPVALGQQVTFVTPQSKNERLPWEDEQSGLVMTADARLDNREELFDLLRIDRPVRTGMGDGQLILHAYRRWGEACLQYLLGDFSFALWDRSRQQMFCARDFIGVRPFYYHISRTGFYFASDIAALLEFAAVPRLLDLSYVRTRLESFQFFHKEFSFFKDVYKLPPAQSLLIRSDSVQKSCYWNPEETTAVRFQSDEAYIEKLLELLQEAVSARLRSDFPVGSHISGGLDSSTITAIAARTVRSQGRTLHGFSWAPPPKMRDYPLRDERAVAEKICHQQGVDLHFTPFSAQDLVSQWSLDITIQPAETLTWENPASRVALELGVRTLLSGWGGDEVAAFNGRGYFADLFKRGRWLKMAKELRLRAELHDSRLWEGFRNKVILPLIPDNVLAKLRPHSQHLTPRDPLAPCLQPQFAAALRQVPPLPWRVYREKSGVQCNQIALLQFGHLTNRMESWAASGGRQGMTYAYPLLDRRVVEYCLGVPAYLYFKNGWKRYMFREAVTHILPFEAQWKKMKDDPSLTRQNMVLIPEAQLKLRELMLKNRDLIQKRGYVEVDDLIASLDPSTQSTASTSNCFANARQRIWLAFVTASS
jgi:asparagine synthase (glutamine-hydrolysing)